MHHLIRSGIYRSPKSALAENVYRRAKEALKLAYRQGRAKQELTGYPLVAADHIAKRIETEKQWCIDNNKAPMEGSNVYVQAHQRGRRGLRFDGSTPKLKRPSQ